MDVSLSFLSQEGKSIFLAPKCLLLVIACAACLPLKLFSWNTCAVPLTLLFFPAVKNDIQASGQQTKDFPKDVNAGTTSHIMILMREYALLVTLEKRKRWPCYHLQWGFQDSWIRDSFTACHCLVPYIQHARTAIIALHWPLLMVFPWSSSSSWISGTRKRVDKTSERKRWELEIMTASDEWRKSWWSRFHGLQDCMTWNPAVDMSAHLTKGMDLVSPNASNVTCLFAVWSW